MQKKQEDAPEGETGICLNESVDKKDNFHILDVTGGHGPWQFRHWVIFFLSSLCCSMHLFSTLSLMSLSFCQCLQTSENKTHNVPKTLSCNISSCHLRENQASWDQLSDPCFAPMPNRVLEYSEEENLQCSNTGVVIYGKCLFAVGSLIAIATTYPLINRFGRRSVSLTFCFLLSASSLATIWAFASATYLILKFMISLGSICVYLIASFSLTDCVTEEFRLVYLFTGHISWGVAHFLLPLLIWSAPTWTLFNAILSIPCFLLLAFVSFLPETAESYASRGLWTRAHKVMRNAARCNGYSLQKVEQFPPNLLLHQSEEDEEIDLRNRLENYSLTIQNTCLFLIGFLSSFTYFTSMWFTDWLQFKRSSYFSLLGTTEVASSLILMFFSYFLPMRRLWATTAFMSSILLIVMYSKASNEAPSFSKSSHIVQMFFASASWSLILLHFLSQNLKSKKSRYRAFVIGCAIYFGLLGAALVDLQKLIGWNRNIFLIVGVPNVIIGACIGLMPNRYLAI